jgi:CRP-like cAMP-binding protein
MTTASSTPALDQADSRKNSDLIAPQTPLPELIEALKRVAPLHGMEESEYKWLAEHGAERFVPAGTTLFHEGDAADKMSILLRGEIHVRRERQGPAALFIGRTGQITGLLPFSRMKTYGGMGYVVQDIWALEFHRLQFPEMTQAVPSMTQRCVSVLLDRVREVTRLEQQSEKLNALGKLAGNLAHEMNNPASAAQRAASGLLDELRVYGHEKYRLGALCLDNDHLAKVRNWQESIREQGKLAPRDAVDHAGLEDRLQGWLKNHGVDETWKIAPELAELNVTTQQLDPLGEFLNSAALSVVLGQFASSVRAERIAEAGFDRAHLRSDPGDQGLLVPGPGTDPGSGCAAGPRKYADHAAVAPGERGDRAPVCGGSAADRSLRKRTQPGVDGAARECAGRDRRPREADHWRRGFR